MRVLVLFAAMLMGQLALAEDLGPFSLKGNSSASAIVDDQKLELILNALETPDDYKTRKNFTLNIGGCGLDISATKAGTSNVDYVINDGRVPDPKGITATPTLVIFAIDGGAKNISCKVTFTSIDDGKKYSVNVSLSGDVPPNLHLTSQTAKLGSSPNSSAESKSWIVILVVGIAVTVGILA